MDQSQLNGSGSQANGNMRIIHFTPAFWPLIGGREVLIEKLSQSLLARGHELVIVSGIHQPKLPEQEVRDGIRIHRFPFRQALESKDIKLIGQILQRLTRLNLEFKPDVVHLHCLELTRFFCLRPPRTKPKRLLATVHGYLENPTEHIHRMLTESLRATDQVTAVSASALARLLELVPDVKDRATAIRNGCQPPSLEPLPLPFDPPQVLCLGRLEEAKCFDLAISAFAQVKQHFPSAKLTVAGDGPMRSRLEQQSESIGLGNSVRFLGVIPNDGVWEVLNQATIVVMPSLMEGLGLVALEASLMERPVIASRVGGLPEAVIHGRTGLLFEPQDLVCLTQAMIELLQDPKRAQAMGKAARQHVLTNFSWPEFVDRYEGLYRKMIAQIN